MPLKIREKRLRSNSNTGSEVGWKLLPKKRPKLLARLLEKAVTDRTVLARSAGARSVLLTGFLDLLDMLGRQQKSARPVPGAHAQTAGFSRAADLEAGSATGAAVRAAAKDVTAGDKLDPKRTVAFVERTRGRRTIQVARQNDPSLTTSSHE
jgi:hypothetical protein